MPNSGGYFSEILSNNNDTNYISKGPNTNIKSLPISPDKGGGAERFEMEIYQEDIARENENAICHPLKKDKHLVSYTSNKSIYLLDKNVLNSLESEDECNDSLKESFVIKLEDQYRNRYALLKRDKQLVHDVITVCPENGIELNSPAANLNDASTPKSSRHNIVHNKLPVNKNVSIADQTSADEVFCNKSLSYLQTRVNDNFLPNLEKTKINNSEIGINSLSPISTTKFSMDIESTVQLDLKRKRESFDNVSLISAESFVPPKSTKKPKLLRTASFTKTIKRSISFVAKGTPKMLRTRRNSDVLDSERTDDDLIAYLRDNADDSFCSTTSFDTMFNESICKPVKEKLRSLRNQFIRTHSHKEKHSLQTSPKNYQIENNKGFKTPKAPLRYPSLSVTWQSAPKPQTRSFTKMCSNSPVLTTIDGLIRDSPVSNMNPSSPSVKIKHNKALSSNINIVQNLLPTVAHTSIKTVYKGNHLSPTIADFHYPHEPINEDQQEQRANVDLSLKSSTVFGKCKLSSNEKTVYHSLIKSLNAEEYFDSYCSTSLVVNIKFELFMF